MMIFEEYNRMHRYYTKTDGVLALAVYFVSVLLFFFAGYMVRNQGTRLFVPASILSAALVVLILLIRKEGPGTIGIARRHFWKSVLLGLVTGAPVYFAIRFVIGASLFARAYGGVEIMNLLMGNRFYHVEETPLFEWFPMAFLFIIITVVHQEVLMRGYVQTRLRGLIKSDFASTIVSGLLFVVFFMPLHSLLVGESIGWVFMSAFPLRLFWMFFLHLWLNLLYRLYNNWAAPVIFHIFFSFHINATLVHSYLIGF